MISSKRSWRVLLIVAGLLLSTVAPAFAQDEDPAQPGGLPAGNHFLFLPSARNDAVTVLTVPPQRALTAARATAQRTLPAGVASLKLDQPIAADDSKAELDIAPLARQAQGKVSVVVQLADPSLAERQAAAGVSAAAVDAAAIVSAAEAQQAQVVAAAQALDAGTVVLGSVQKALNAVMLELDAHAVNELAADPQVRSVRPVVDYQLDLAETVPYIGATAVQNSGYTGKGIRVAVLDSGIDYTHANFGGIGTTEAYTEAYGTSNADPRNTTRDGLFPTAKVVEGYDFVGESWPNGDLAPDEDPIDYQGHGTHVADIVAGVNGVAPGASLYALKVCSAVATDCSGVALLEAMDYVVDPNGDLDTSDHLDIVNMSLGQSYGQAYDDSLAQAVENASKLGVLTVASAGNSGDKPFVVSAPSVAPSALSVAETEVPSAMLPVIEILAPASISGSMGGMYQPFSAPLNGVIEDSLQYGNGAGGNLLACGPFAPDSLAGKILLANLGTCAVSIKVSNAAAAGAAGVLIGMVAPGDPSVFSYGGGTPSVPGITVSQADANMLRSGLAEGVNLRIDPLKQEPLVRHVVSSSSRGPTMLTQIVKPEIGAPGASVSAVVGTGTGTETFGGTSGAAPMVTGASALLKQAYPDRTVAEIKAVLVNTGDTNIMNKAAIFGGTLAPISRIGGGEVRVDRALNSPVAAWEADTEQPAISLGFNDWVRNGLTTRSGVTVRNYANTSKGFTIDIGFRYGDDALRGSVTISAPSQVWVGPNATGNFGLDFQVNTDRLDPWTLNSGAEGANGGLLTRLEYDGYITLTNIDDPNETIHLPWHILPRGAGEIGLGWQDGLVQLYNNGESVSTVEAYSLIGENGKQSAGGPGEDNPKPDLRYVGYATYPVEAGVCSANPSFVMAFAANTFEPQTHANHPFSFEIDIDADQNGTVDYAVFTAEQPFGSLGLDGRNVTYVQNMATGKLSTYFYTDHQIQSGNTVMFICGEQIGMNAANFFDPMNITALAVDNYFTGMVTDAIDGITISPLGERYLALFEQGGIGTTFLAPKQGDRLRFVDYGATTNNTESGLMLLYRDGAQPGVEVGVLYAGD
jgi:minor extracellular serine protease Vpr